MALRFRNRSAASILALLLAGCSRGAPAQSAGLLARGTESPSAGTAAATSPAPSTVRQAGATLPEEALGLFPAGAQVIDSRSVGSGPNGTLVVLLALTGQPAASAGSMPPMAELAIVSKTPSGWRLAKAVIQSFAQAPKLDATVQIDHVPAVGLEYHTGANSQGLIVVRNNAVVFDAVADSFEMRDLNDDGSAEVIKSWSPFCQSHVASPRLNTVYVWESGSYAPATDRFPSVIAQDTTSFQGAVARANAAQTTPAWSAKDKACLHDALAYLAELAGNRTEADAQYAQVKRLAPDYDLQTIRTEASR